MLDFAALHADLESAGLADWIAGIDGLVRQNLREGAHGRLHEWQAVLQNLPHIPVTSTHLNGAAVSAIAPSVDGETQTDLRKLLLQLLPWRKGPFDICGIRIDCEWQSDRKWSRIAGCMSPLRDRMVLDVGCGNGYYALRMSGQAARFVLGIDATLQYVAQFLAIQHYVRQPAVQVLPLRLADLPTQGHAFDTTFSMGVLYHQRDPLEHLSQLHDTLRGGGELILETLVMPGDDRQATTPDERYARMRNVWQLPTIPLLESWLEDAGFEACRIADTSVTTTDEQRTTEWMPFESLQEALDPMQPDLTVEGLPRPRRTVVIAQRPT